MTMTLDDYRQQFVDLYRKVLPEANYESSGFPKPAFHVVREVLDNYWAEANLEKYGRAMHHGTLGHLVVAALVEHGYIHAEYPPTEDGPYSSWAMRLDEPLVCRGLRGSGRTCIKPIA